jgi:hypothetical protein
MNDLFIKELQDLAQIRTLYAKALMQELTIKEFGISCIRNMHLPRKEEYLLMLSMDQEFPVNYESMVDWVSISRPSKHSMIIGSKKQKSTEEEEEEEEEDDSNWIAPAIALSGGSLISILAFCSSELGGRMCDQFIAFLKKHVGGGQVIEETTKLLKTYKDQVKTLADLLTQSIRACSDKTSTSNIQLDQATDEIQMYANYTVFTDKVKNWIKIKNETMETDIVKARHIIEKQRGYLNEIVTALPKVQGIDPYKDNEIFQTWFASRKNKPLEFTKVEMLKIYITDENTTLDKYLPTYCKQMLANKQLMTAYTKYIESKNAVKFATTSDDLKNLTALIQAFEKRDEEYTKLIATFKTYMKSTNHVKFDITTDHWKNLTALIQAFEKRDAEYAKLIAAYNEYMKSKNPVKFEKIGTELQNLTNLIMAFKKQDEEYTKIPTAVYTKLIKAYNDYIKSTNAVKFEKKGTALEDLTNLIMAFQKQDEGYTRIPNADYTKATTDVRVYLKSNMDLIAAVNHIITTGAYVPGTQITKLTDLLVRYVGVKAPFFNQLPKLIDHLTQGTQIVNKQPLFETIWDELRACNASFDDITTKLNDRNTQIKKSTKYDFDDIDKTNKIKIVDFILNVLSELESKMDTSD